MFKRYLNLGCTDGTDGPARYFLQVSSVERAGSAPTCVRNRAKITSHLPAGPFGRQLRCSLVSDPLPGYAPRSRLASGQNFCAVKHEFIFARSLTTGRVQFKMFEAARYKSCAPAALAVLVVLCAHGPRLFGQSLSQLLNNAPTTQAPQSKLAPDTQPGFNPLKVIQSREQFNHRQGKVILSNGRVLRGEISTTVDTPFRIWISSIKRYRDISLMRIRRMDVQILAQREIRQWRYLQNGSDIKVYSGKTQPWFRFAYTFTLLHGEKIAGTVVAPLFVRTRRHRYNLLLSKHLEGKIGEPVAEVVYVQHIILKVTPAILASRKKMTHKLPLVDWRILR